MNERTTSNKGKWKANETKDSSNFSNILTELVKMNVIMIY